jgi:hypothetical protein
MRETRVGLTQWFNTDSGFEFNTLFNTFATVVLRGLRARLVEGQLVVSDKPGCGGWTFAQDLGIATMHFPPKRGDAGAPIQRCKSCES